MPTTPAKKRRAEAPPPAEEVDSSTPRSSKRLRSSAAKAKAESSSSTPSQKITIAGTIPTSSSASDRIAREIGKAIAARVVNGGTSAVGAAAAHKPEEEEEEEGEEDEEDEAEVAPHPSPRKKNETKKGKSAKKATAADAATANPRTGSTKAKVRSAKKEEEEKVEVEEAEETTPRKKAPCKPKVKPEDMPPLAPRTASLKMFIGAHVSAAGGVHNTVANATHIGANAFACFLKSQRKWANPPLSAEHRDAFHKNCSDHKYSAAEHVLPHGSYLVNLAQAEPERRKQAMDSFLDDLKRCDQLGIRLYNFHPGNTAGQPRQEALARIAQAINEAHAATEQVVPVLENMAGGPRGAEGNVIGSTFEDLAGIIQLVKDKSRVGVCLDTCHAFAAGYDLRSPAAFAATMEHFERTVGFRYLRALHLNDSKAPLGSGRDLHANIGTGFLGLRAFHCVMNERRFEGLPMVLETPIDEGEQQQSDDEEEAQHKSDCDSCDDGHSHSKKKKAKKAKPSKAKAKPVEDKGVWAREIKLLESLIGMDVEASDNEFGKLETELAERGRAERERVAAQVEKRNVKDNKKQSKLDFGK